MVKKRRNVKRTSATISTNVAMNALRTSCLATLTPKSQLSPLINLLFCGGNSDSAAPVAPPRRNKDQSAAAEDEAPKTLYEKLPDSFKSEVLVRSKVEVDEKVLKERQELTRSMSPAQVTDGPSEMAKMLWRISTSI